MLGLHLYAKGCGAADRAGDAGVGRWHEPAIVSETDQWGLVTDGLLLAAVDLGAGIP